VTALDDFMARGARRRGVTLRPSRFRGRGHSNALWLGTREIAHWHNGQVDVRLTRALDLLRHAKRAARTIAP
jgi:hypothetical protein